MAIRKDENFNADEQFEKRQLKFKNQEYYKNDNESIVHCFRLGKKRKEALQEHLKLEGKNISSFVRELVYDYMDKNGIRPVEEKS